MKEAMETKIKKNNFHFIRNMVSHTQENGFHSFSRTDDLIFGPIYRASKNQFLYQVNYV